MQVYSATNVPPAGPKNYVFVDEHNRHKRLKVMRACEGCRRRKIKCDAATTNSWPCAACKRLKLTCVPPVGGVDGDMGPSAIGDDVMNIQATNTTPPKYLANNPNYMPTYMTAPEYYQQYQNYDPAPQQHMFAQQTASPLSHDPPHLPGSMQPIYAPRYSSFDSTNGNNLAQSASSPQSIDSVTAEELAENLGELRIQDTGVAPYIRQQNQSRKEAPAPIVDDEEDLPALSTVAGSQIRIPPALMPNDDEAMAAFEAFFEHVHPYAPVLCKEAFYRQWRQERHTISPLLLEAVLACAGQVSDEDVTGGSQWLALANRHEENFADQPRLSTIQALFLILKAREKVPKRGYYYRSWVTLKKIVAMAKDLELHEHHEIHEAGIACDSTKVDCLCKTRIWQLAMCCEVMIGAPQGRYDYGVDLTTVDLSTNPPNSDINEYEKKTSREFAYWVKNVRNIRGLTETYHKLKRLNKEWATDAKFVAYNEDFRKWPGEVPEDLRIDITENGTLPRLPSHFIANVHCHYQLGIVLLYKPQLQASRDFANDEKWKYCMSLCYRAAKDICILQEATLQEFDIIGLSCMMRGLSFSIYAILSCIMIHLIAITSPDPDFNTDARVFFTRHMRVLEKCIAEWPMPEVEEQIQGLRAAFSADLNRPFDLKPSFPYSTSEASQGLEERRASEQMTRAPNSHDDSHLYVNRSQSENLFMSPPPSDGQITKQQTPHYYPEYATDPSAQQFHHIPPTSHPGNPMVTTEHWNPTPIIDQFSNAFAIPQSALAPPPSHPGGYGSSPPLVIPQQQNLGNQMQASQYMPSPTSAGGYSSHAFTPPQGDHPLSATHNNNPYMNAHIATQGSQQSLHRPNNLSDFAPPNAPFMHTHANSSQHSLHAHQQLTPSHELGPQQFFDAATTSTTPTHSHQPYSTHTFSAAIANTVPMATAGISHSAGQPVYVTPKEWQQSVASVIDSGGLKRKWEYDQQAAAMQQGYPGMR